MSFGPKYPSWWGLVSLAAIQKAPRAWTWFVQGGNLACVEAVSFTGSHLAMQFTRFHGRKACAPPALARATLDNKIQRYKSF